MIGDIRPRNGACSQACAERYALGIEQIGKVDPDLQWQTFRRLAKARNHPLHDAFSWSPKDYEEHYFSWRVQWLLDAIGIVTGVDDLGNERVEKLIWTVVHNGVRTKTTFDAAMKPRGHGGQVISKLINPAISLIKRILAMYPMLPAEERSRYADFVGFIQRAAEAMPK